MPYIHNSNTGSPTPSGAGFFDGGEHYPFPAVAVEELVRAHQPHIARIKLCSGLDQPGFAAELLPLITAYAAYVHLLPATPDHHHAYPGGLLSLGLEVGFYSLQGSDAHIFSGRSTISVRYRLEPLWRTATFIGGLCHCLHLVMNQLTVHDATGRSWSPCVQPLSSWLREHEVSRFALQWKTRQALIPALNLFALPHIVSTALMQRLAHDNETVLPHLFACLSGIPAANERNILHELVSQACALVLEQETDRLNSQARPHPQQRETPPSAPDQAQPPEPEPAANPPMVDQEDVPPCSTRLNAPLRLDSSTSRTLGAVVQEMNGAGTREMVPVAQGFFIPLSAFSDRGMDPPAAIRALLAARMLDLPHAHANPVVQHAIDGTDTAGIVLPRRYVLSNATEAIRHEHAPL